jgi:hypothetical protein
MSRPVLIFRWIVLILAAFYFADRFRVEEFGNMEEFGWQFRYLTIWGLTGSLIAAVLMLIPEYGAPGRKAAGFVSVVGVVNMIVVVSYWRLYFKDPTLVMGEKEIVAYREYYLHMLGPLLQWIDLLWIKRAFRWPGRVAAWLGALVVAYLVWAELVIQPLNDEPVGTVANGLPYPFLNDMVFTERLVFYGATFVSGRVFLLVLWGAQAGLNRLRSA